MTQSSSDRSSTSRTLLERVKRRRPEAWRRLVELYGPLVYRWCRRHRLAPEDAADIVQEVFAAVAQHIDRFEFRPEQGGFRAWLGTITRNEICDFYRREQGRAKGHGGTDAQEQLAQVPEHDDPSDFTDHADDSQLISSRALELVRAEFENRTWEAFHRAVIDGQQPAHIAEDLGISVNAVYKAKSRVLRRLRQELGELLD
jgi:RNA polymerase sigma-70 factor (ECF subfamily)